MRRLVLLPFLAVLLFATLSITLSLRAQGSRMDQVQVSPPMRRAEPPSPSASVEELEKRGDMLRGNKAYLDALDYYHAALVRNPNSAPIYNKAGIAQLQLQHYKEAKKSFEHAIKADRQRADAYNNLGAVLYEEKKYGGAIKNYDHALKLEDDNATFYSNLGAAYFAKKEFEKAAVNYAKALQLDPNVFDHHSRTGVSAQLPSPEDRARYAFVMAKLYAAMGVADRSLEYLRRAMEEGYKGVEAVYKDPEFAVLRKDARFSELMASRPIAISN